MTAIDGAMVVQRRGAPLFTRLDDELLALDPAAGLCYSLNSTAARVWELIDSPTPVRVLCDELEREFAVDRPTAERDVVELLGRLRDAGLIEVGEGAG